MWTQKNQFLELANQRRWRECAHVLASAAPLPMHEVAKDTPTFRALIEAFEHGGLPLRVAAAKTLRSKSDRLDRIDSFRLHKAAAGSAAYAFRDALALHQWDRLPALFAVLMDTPAANAKPLRLARACFAAYLREATLIQHFVTEAFLNEPLRLSTLNEFDGEMVARYVGTTRVFTTCADLLLLTVNADRYPGYGRDCLERVLCVAQWPMLAFIGGEVETMFYEHLTDWFLHPKSREMFSEPATRWLKHAVQGRDENDVDPMAWLPPE